MNIVQSKWIKSYLNTSKLLFNLSQMWKIGLNRNLEVFKIKFSSILVKKCCDNRYTSVDYFINCFNKSQSIFNKNWLKTGQSCGWDGTTLIHCTIGCIKFTCKYLNLEIQSVCPLVLFQWPRYLRACNKKPIRLDLQDRQIDFPKKWNLMHPNVQCTEI